MNEATASKRFTESRCRHGIAASRAWGNASTQRGGYSERGGYSTVTWLNLTCLDAPLVAVCWLWLFARSFEIPIARGGGWALFLTAWLIYLADRFGDRLSIRSGSPTSSRQRFAVRHRSAWIGAMALIAAADLAVIALKLEPRISLLGAAVGAFALAYLIVNRIWPRLWRLLPVKEVSIGCLFAAGTMVPLSHAPKSALFPAWLAFACLCSLNCISIAVWERELDAAQERVSIATAFPRIIRYVLLAPVILALCSFALGMSASSGRDVFVCIGASAILLAAVHLLARIRPDIRTALADLVLLTPAVVALTDSII